MSNINSIWNYLSFISLLSGLTGVMEGSMAGSRKFKYGSHSIVEFNECRYLFLIAILSFLCFLALGLIGHFVERTLTFVWLSILVYQVSFVLLSLINNVGRKDDSIHDFHSLVH